MHQFTGHIAFDAASQSEILLPVNVNGVTVMVLDIDSPIIARFSATDQQGVAHFVAQVQEELVF